MTSHTPHPPLCRRVLSLPLTRLGWWSVALAATFVVLLIVDYGGLVLPLYGIVLLLCGLCGGAVGLIAVVGRCERSGFVWLTMLPVLAALVFLIGELLHIW